MANAFMTITSETHGLISQGCSSQEVIGEYANIEHVDEVSVLGYRHEIVNEGGVMAHRPFIITKHLDLLSPFLFRTANKEEEFDCVMSQYQPSSDGPPEKFFVIELKGASVMTAEFGAMEGSPYGFEFISLRYREISLTHVSSNTTSCATWTEAEIVSPAITFQRVGDALCEHHIL